MENDMNLVPSEYCICIKWDISKDIYNKNLSPQKIERTTIVLKKKKTTR